MTASGISPGKGDNVHGRNGSHMTSIDPVETRNETQSCRITYMSSKHKRRRRRRRRREKKPDSQCSLGTTRLEFVVRVLRSEEKDSIRMLLVKVNSLRAPEGRRWSITILGWPDSRAPSRQGMKGVSLGSIHRRRNKEVLVRLIGSLSGTVPRGARGLIARRLRLLR